MFYMVVITSQLEVDISMINIPFTFEKHIKAYEKIARGRDEVMH